MTLKIHLSLGILTAFPSQRIQTDIPTREFCYPNDCLFPVVASQQGEHAKGLLGYCSGTSLTRTHIVRWLERCSPRLSCHTANESMLAS